MEGTEAPAPKITFCSDILTDKIHTTHSKMLFSEKFSDVHLYCPEGTILHAHKNVLSSSSSYFAVVFEGLWADEHPDGVWNTSNSANLMRIIITNIYTHTYDDTEISKDPLAVLSLGRQYNLMSLVHIAESTLMEQINKDNVKELIQAAALYDLASLKESCFNFISLNAIYLLTDEYNIKLTSEDKTLWKEMVVFIMRR